MILTPQAQRLVAEAVRELPGQARDKWRSWSECHTGGRLPEDLAPIALSALELIAGRIEQRLAITSISEDEEMDLLNELGFVQAIAGQLRHETDGAERRRA
jgi:hypothetical protein